MDIEQLTINCNDCDAWYTPKQVDHTTDTCPACEGSLSHAHESGQQTPYMRMRADLIKMEISRYEDLIEDLRRVLTDECWEDQ